MTYLGDILEITRDERDVASDNPTCVERIGSVEGLAGSQGDEEKQCERN